MNSSNTDNNKNNSCFGYTYTDFGVMVKRHYRVVFSLFFKIHTPTAISIKRARRELGIQDFCEKKGNRKKNVAI